MNNIIWIAEYFDGEHDDYFTFAEVDNEDTARATFKELYKHDFDIDIEDEDIDCFIRVAEIEGINDTYKINLEKI
jgi:hypothetical protein